MSEAKGVEVRERPQEGSEFRRDAEGFAEEVEVSKRGMRVGEDGA